MSEKCAENRRKLRNRAAAPFLLFLRVGWLLVICAGVAGAGDPATTVPRTAPRFSNTATGVRYVGSRTCAKCHFLIFESYRKTGMGRSVRAAGAVAAGPLPATVHLARLHRSFTVFRRNGALYQQEYAVHGKKRIFQETEKLDWVVGDGHNGYSYLVRRGPWLFEAPLSWYARQHAWGPSPGYGHEDLGFSRLIRPGCLDCHSGRPRWAAPGSTRLLRPALAEPAIGCERCHGPGSLHVQQRLQGLPVAGSYDASIVNPARLPLWMADDICMNCHQEGDAEVLQPGRHYGDFRPGTPLRRTVALFELTPGRNQKLDSVLVHYVSSLHLSRCYRASGGKLGCLTCHDPHMQPAAAQAPAWFRSRCLTCHTEQSCPLPLARRQAMHPADNCVGCHMPERSLAADMVAHSALTDHRIAIRPGEPIPRLRPSLESPGLLLLDPVPGASPDFLPPQTLLQAYGQLLPAHPEFARDWVAELRQLARTEPNQPVVLSALARDAMLSVPPRPQDAIADLEAALRHGSREPGDLRLLATLLLQRHRPGAALALLLPAARRQPWDGPLFLLLGKALLQRRQPARAAAWLRQGLQWTPHSDALRRLLRKAQRRSARTPPGAAR